MTPPADRPTLHADFHTPEMVAARKLIHHEQYVVRTEISVEFIRCASARLGAAWVNYDNLLYDAGHRAGLAVPPIPAPHEDTDLLTDLWFNFSFGRTYESESWWGCDGLSTLNTLAATLLERGVLEKHSTRDWYRRAPAPEN